MRFVFQHLRRSLAPWPAQGRHGHGEAHRAEGFFLRETIFGANDGLVSNVSLVAGVAGATPDSNTVLLAGTAGLVAGAISMTLGAYISTKSEREFRASEERRERWEIANMPREERAEIRQIFQNKGISGPTLDIVVEQVTSDHDRWVQIMMHDELGFSEHPPRPVAASIVMGIAFSLGALFPVGPYLFLDGSPAFAFAVSMTAVALFGLGAWRSHLTGGKVWQKAFEMVGLASIAVLAANVIGRLVGVGIY